MPSLDAITILSGLPPDRRREIERQCDWRTFPTNATILHYGDDTDHVAFLTRGRVRVRIYSISGRVVAYRDLGPGNVFGEFSAIDPAPRSASVEAIESCEVALMPGTAFRAMLARDACVTLAVLIDSIALNRSLTERVRELATLDVGERVASELLRLAQTSPIVDGRAVVDPLPYHHDLAERIGTTREGVTKKLKHFTRVGILKKLTTHAVSVDVEALRELLAIEGDEE